MGLDEYTPQMDEPVNSSASTEAPEKNGSTQSEPKRHIYWERYWLLLFPVLLELFLGGFCTGLMVDFNLSVTMLIWAWQTLALLFGVVPTIFCMKRTFRDEPATNLVEGFKRLSSGLLGCFMVGLGYYVFVLGAISICRHYEIRPWRSTGEAYACNTLLLFGRLFFGAIELHLIELIKARFIIIPVTN